MSSKYEQLEHVTDAQFRRLTGVIRSIFTLMVQTYKQVLIASYKRPGRPCTLTAEDKIPMMLEYNREYRTYFHVANSFAISEANAYKVIQTVEDLLIKSGAFSLSGKKALCPTDDTLVCVLIDATESKIRRPKKTKAPLFKEKVPSSHKGTGCP